MNAKVLVLLSTYNGEKFLQDQIDSIFRQENVDVFLLIRDDCSSDKTVEIIRYNQQRFPLKIKLVEGKNVGCTKSFVELMHLALDLKEYTPDYYAFCDQDDVWLPDKLSRSVTVLSSKDPTLPQLFFGTSTVTDSYLHAIKVNSSRKYKYTLGESLVGNISVGNTHVFNRLLLEKAVSVKFCPYILHDWWIYSVCLALSGIVFMEQIPLLLYRQHCDNAIGIKQMSLFNKVKGVFSPVNPNISYRLAEALYNGFKDDLPENNKRLLKIVVAYRSSFIGKLRLLWFSKLFRTYYIKTNIRFMLSVLLGVF